jgi:hypothetical protein
VSVNKPYIHCKHIPVEVSVPANTILGRAMAQAVSRRPLTAEARVCARVNPCGICDGSRKGLSLSFSVFPCQYIIPPCSPTLITWGGEQYAR